MSDDRAMRRRDFDPSAAKAAQQQLAATTDEDLAAGIRQAADGAVAAISTVPGLDSRARAALAQTRRALAALPAEAPVRDLQRGVASLLEMVWPDFARVATAVDQLRTAAMHRPTLVSAARWIASGQ